MSRKAPYTMKNPLTPDSPEEAYARAMTWLTRQGIAEQVGGKSASLLVRVVTYGQKAFHDGFLAGEKQGKST